MPNIRQSYVEAGYDPPPPDRWERLRRALWDALAGHPLATVHLNDLLSLVEESDMRTKPKVFVVERGKLVEELPVIPKPLSLNEAIAVSAELPEDTQEPKKRPRLKK